MQYPKTPHSIACRTWSVHDMLHPRQVLTTHTNKHAAPLSKTWHFAKGSSNTYHLTESRQQTAARLAQATKAEYSRRLLLLFETTSPLRRAAASHSATPRGAAASGALRVRPRRLVLARRWDSIAASVVGGHVGRTWRAAKATGILREGLRVRPRLPALARRSESMATSVVGGHVGRTWRAAKAAGILRGLALDCGNPWRGAWLADTSGGYGWRPRRLEF